jgi:8-oxo-dGTP pyrophosphatase MutT (NUDIX family)
MEQLKKKVTKRFVLGASCLIFRSNSLKQFLLIKRLHPPNIGSWCLPGGHIEFHEDIVAAMKREFLEETGY